MKKMQNQAKSVSKRTWREKMTYVKKNWQLYLFFLMPGLLLTIIFKYLPMGGLLIAFEDYNVIKGVLGSPWVGLEYFRRFLSSPDFMSYLMNTLKLSIYGLLWGFPVPIILALLMSMLLIVSTGCGKSGSGDSSSDKKTDKTETLADVNTIPEDGVITKEQFKTVAGENKKVQFKGTTDDGITYIWTYDCSKIQNPADQNLKIDFSEKDLDDLKKQANNANDALKMTMYGKGLICVPDLEVQLPEAWQSNSAYLVKEQSGKLARMSDVVVTAQVKEENKKKQDTKKEEKDSSDKTAKSTTQAKKDTKPKEGTTSLKMSVTSLDGDCYIIGGITEQQNKGAASANKAENGTTNSEAEGSDESGNSGENSYNEEGSSGSGDVSDGGASSSGSSGKQDVANDEEVSGSSHTCTISISCATILNNMSDLKSGKEEFVPSDGWILAASEVEFTEGESVHDVLQRVCKDAGIQMESSFTPAYNSAYVEGINNLYEFDCGQLSGWMYNVNGWFPNYGCSKYTVQDGDVINWVYTCNLGKDVGDNSMY